MPAGFVYPSLDYEPKTMVRVHHVWKGYTQEEFDFLIGRDKAYVMKYEDLTTSDPTISTTSTAMHVFWITIPLPMRQTKTQEKWAFYHGG